MNGTASVPRPAAGVAVALLSVAAALLAAGKATAALVSYFGISRALAGAIVTVIVNSGVWTAVAIWPFLAPVAITARTIAAVFGTSALISY